jgi:hypothetical protein
MTHSYWRVRSDERRAKERDQGNGCVTRLDSQVVMLAVNSALRRSLRSSE